MGNRIITEDIILETLYKDPDIPLRPGLDILNKHGYSIDPIELRKVVKGLIADGLIIEGEPIGRENRVRITDKAVSILNEHKTYSNYLNSLKKEKNKNQRLGLLDRGLAITFGLATLVLGIMTHSKDNKLTEKENQIEELKKDLTKQESTSDSLTRVLMDTTKVIVR
jgi:hypothetical protein